MGILSNKSTAVVGTLRKIRIHAQPLHSSPDYMARLVPREYWYWCSQGVLLSRKRLNVDSCPSFFFKPGQPLIKSNVDEHALYGLRIFEAFPFTILVGSGSALIPIHPQRSYGALLLATPVSSWH